MTLDGFINLIESIDPGAVRYDAIGQKGDAYTVYSEYRTNLLWADNEICESSIAVQVDYYTREPDDPKAQTFLETFAEHDEICVSYDTDFDSESRYTRHIFSCELI